jgi:hypothetical protein
MKSHLFLASSILASLTLLFVMGSSSTAQQTTTRPSQSTQELQIPELEAEDVDAESLRIRIPRECPKPPEVQMHDVADGFTSPGNPVTLSPLLINFLSGKPIKGYDDSRIDRVFADSFKLRSCRVCYVTLEFRVRHYAGAWQLNAPWWPNDTVLAGAAPFPTTPDNYRFIGPMNIWTPNSNSPLGITPTGLARLNQYLATGPISPVMDVVAQDDSDFDYVRLSVWYY